MGILGSVVEHLALGKLVDDEPEEDTEDHSLVEGVANHVKGLVVDAMQLLHPLHVVLLRGCVGNRPQTQVVHVAQHGPVVLESDGQALLFHGAVLVSELAHADVVRV